MKEIVLATDLGGTNLRMAAIESEGGILFQTKCSTPKTDSVSEILDIFLQKIDECRSNIKIDHQLKGISFAVPGGVDYKKRMVIKAPNLPCLEGFPLADFLEEKLNLKVILENDANAAAVGESWIGASRNFQNSIMLTLGTGVGSGIIIDEKILRGVDGMAGEIGHICLEPTGNPCGCGSRGCLEQYTSATAVTRQTNELKNQFPNSILNENSCFTSADVYQAGKAGDELALEVFRRVGYYLGVALSGLINTLNPEVIVIGGGVALGWDLFISHAQKEINAHAHRVSVERVKILPAKLGDDAGILGAAKLGFEVANLAKIAVF
jgi:glucokinase